MLLAQSIFSASRELQTTDTEGEVDDVTKYLRNLCLGKAERTSVKLIFERTTQERTAWAENRKPALELIKSGFGVPDCDELATMTKKRGYKVAHESHMLLYELAMRRMFLSDGQPEVKHHFRKSRTETIKFVDGMASFDGYSCSVQLIPNLLNQTVTYSRTQQQVEFMSCEEEVWIASVALSSMSKNTMYYREALHHTARGDFGKVRQIISEGLAEEGGVVSSRQIFKMVKEASGAQLRGRQSSTNISAIHQ